jgi:hypothetical protein
MIGLGRESVLNEPLKNVEVSKRDNKTSET